jgi:hypothetical protein
MCIWTANSRQIPPAIQRYIPTSVQRSDLNTSQNWSIGVRVVRAPAYFRASSWRRQRRRRNGLLGEEWNRWERWASGRVAKTGWTEKQERWWFRAQTDAMLGIDGTAKRASLLGPQRGCNGHQNQPRYLVVATWGSTMVSLWGLGGVIVTAEKMAEPRYVSYGRWHGLGWGPTVWRIDRDGENNEKSSRYLPSRLRIATKRILAKASTDPGFASLLDSEDLEDMIMVHGRLSNEGLSNIDFSRTLIAQENSTSTSSTYLIKKELMLRKCWDWRQETSRTVIIKTYFYEEKEG